MHTPGSDEAVTIYAYHDWWLWWRGTTRQGGGRRAGHLVVLGLLTCVHRCPRIATQLHGMAGDDAMLGSTAQPVFIVPLEPQSWWTV